MGILEKFKIGFKKSASTFTSGLRDIIVKKEIDDKTLNEIEDYLIHSDVGLQASSEIRNIIAQEKIDPKKDFDLIGTEFHRWVRDNKDLLGLTNPEEFHNFINDKYEKYSEIYLNILKYSKKFDKKYETIFFNAHNYLTLQNTILLAPIKSEDNSEIIDKKIRMVARYLDIFLARRIVNYKTIDRNTLEVNLFNLIKNIREQEIKVLNNILETIGNTPIIKLDNLYDDQKVEIYGKFESLNPGGSIKDRICLNMINEAEKEGLINPKTTTIIEPTSGNTGIGLALVCAAKGYKLIAEKIIQRLKKDNAL